MPRKTLLMLLLGFIAIILLVFARIALRVPGKIIACGSVLLIIFVVNLAFDRMHHLSGSRQFRYSRGRTKDEALTINPSAEDATQLQRTLTECITEIDRLRELMRRDDVEVAHSQARTRALLAEIKAMRTPPERKAA